MEVPAYHELHFEVMFMNILLVNPRPIDAYTVYGPSLGLCYLSAYLKSRGITEIEGIDLNIDNNEQMLVAMQNADLVGVYCSTKALRPSLEVAAIAKKLGKTVVFGGPHPSVLPEDIMQNPDVDFVIMSEGEESFYALIEALEGRGELASIDGFCYRSEGTTVINPRTRFVDNLDTIPFPDRALFKFDYTKTVTFCATRGCPYKCSNCQPALSMQTCAFRMRSVENVMEELRLIAPGRLVHFIDNDLTVNKKWIRTLCERIIAEKLIFTWGCQGRVNTLSQDLMSLMKRAGCINIGVGIESGSQTLLDNFLKKQLSLDRAKQVVSESVASGMPLHGWFIIGIPTETLEDMEQTIDFAVNHDFATVGFSIGTPWPGTVFYRIARENSWMLTTNWEEFNEKQFSNLQTPSWGPEDIARTRERIISAFKNKDWIVNENDFVFINPYWGRGIAGRAAVWLYRRLGLKPVVRAIRRLIN